MTSSRSHRFAFIHPRTHLLQLAQVTLLTQRVPIYQSSKHLLLEPYSSTKYLNNISNQSSTNQPINYNLPSSQSTYKHLQHPSPPIRVKNQPSKHSKQSGSMSQAVPTQAGSSPGKRCPKCSNLHTDTGSLETLEGVL